MKHTAMTFSLVLLLACSASALAAEPTNSLTLFASTWRVEGMYNGLRSSASYEAEYAGDFENESGLAGARYKKTFHSKYDDGTSGNSWLDSIFRRQGELSITAAAERRTLMDERATPDWMLNRWAATDDREFETTHIDGAGRWLITNRLALRGGIGVEHEEAHFDIHRESDKPSYNMRNREVSDVVRNSALVNFGIDFLPRSGLVFGLATGIALRRETWDGTGTLILPGYIEGAYYDLTATYNGGDLGLTLQVSWLTANGHLLLGTYLGGSRQVLDGNSLSNFRHGPKLPGHFRQTMDTAHVGLELHIIPVRTFRIGFHSLLRGWGMTRREVLQAGASGMLFNEDWDGIDANGWISLDVQAGSAVSLGVDAGFRRLDWERTEAETLYTKIADGGQDGPTGAVRIEFTF